MQNLTATTFRSPEFGEIRTVEEDGKVLFCGSDVAKALGYKRPNDAISAHCRGTVKRSIGVQTGENLNKVPLTDFGKTIKKRLIDLDKNQLWLIEEVKTGTGLYFDDSYLFKILTGRAATPSIVGSICKILEIELQDETEQKEGL